MRHTPNHNLLLSNGILFLAERSGGSNRPIDMFMKSLASHHNKAKSIAIILSGKGDDGVQGAAAIVNSGGFVIVQTPESAHILHYLRLLSKAETQILWFHLKTCLLFCTNMLTRVALSAILGKTRGINIINEFTASIKLIFYCYLSIQIIIFIQKHTIIIVTLRCIKIIRMPY
ncbi:chemotaxis protein CheB [Niastella sp. OAS944]|uniref:chemotaxis protein CheB n=1 Tax=Niastella sp. OAS944 TaxID=2664089 RepID=UPI0035C7E620|nr:hypothetical protein [Chitinophagaceae bacterium OAS944]